MRREEIFLLGYVRSVVEVNQFPRVLDNYLGLPAVLGGRKERK